MCVIIVMCIYPDHCKFRYTTNYMVCLDRGACNKISDQYGAVAKKDWETLA